MKIRGLITMLNKVNPDAVVKVRYDREFSYSEWTHATVSRIGEIMDEAVIIDKDWIVFAAGLCDCS